MSGTDILDVTELTSCYYLSGSEETSKLRLSLQKSYFELRCYRFNVTEKNVFILTSTFNKH